IRPVANRLLQLRPRRQIFEKGKSTSITPCISLFSAAKPGGSKSQPLSDLLKPAEHVDPGIQYLSNTILGPAYLGFRLNAPTSLRANPPKIRTRRPTGAARLCTCTLPPPSDNGSFHRRTDP